MKKKVHKSRIRPELFIMIAIVLCLTFIFGYSSRIQNNYIGITKNGTVALLSSSEDIAYFDQNGLPLIPYERNSCQSIEIFNDQYESIFKLIFESTERTHDYIVSIKQFSDMIKTEKEGMINVAINDKPLEAKFIWVECNEESFLVVYIINTKNAFELIGFTIIGHVTIVLCFIMLIIIVYWQLKGVSNRYEKSIRDLYSDIT